MRVIGRIPDGSRAAVFSDYLYAQGVSNEIEEDDGAWTVWVHAEEELERARAMLAEFLAQPDHPRYAAERERARRARAAEERAEQEAARKHFDRRRVFRRTIIAGTGRLTMGLIAVSVIVSTLQFLLPHGPILEWLYFGGSDLILRGQVWRLITPIFLHGGVIHLLFNMLWLRDLGTMIEARLGAKQLALLVGVSAALSNVAQYLVAGPAFLGMSGVVYALLGYLWMRGRLDPFSGLFVHQHIFIMMMIWLALCLVGIIPHVANGTHVAGLVVGVGWGYLAAQNAGRR
jgi:GlpG protein